MAKRKYPQLKCAFCGKFISWDDEPDSYVPFGSVQDLEPPEPVFVGPRCVLKEKARIRERMHIFNHWMPARYETEMAAELGFKRAGPERAAWGQWIHQDKELPEGWEWRE